MKRSRTAALLIMGASPLALTSCSQETQSEGLYTSVEACIAQTNDSYTCQQAFDQATQQSEATAPRYASREECIAAHGADQCQQRSDGAGHSYFMPLMTGFLLGQMLRGGQTVGLTGSPAFRDRAGNWQRPGPAAGGGVYRPGAAGASAMVPVTAQPDRAPTVTRGGFGSRSDSSGG
ncbi:DUF1190 domain-containing protein [Dokdonella koreensis]|uniref:Integral membrane protein n=1 Tax=Dokdonella koreensis DS-123 TaxID=1300342 RepID=A0A160DYF3_9GAMM|nr:DUF1190 domain-containing protein [Dokdonella koreensis]ANB19073.1 Putative integral membrane protein [Dokdonella koreensis DS-123]